MATPAQPLFDMSKAVPIAAAQPLFDMSKAQPLNQSAPTQTPEQQAAARLTGGLAPSGPAAVNTPMQPSKVAEFARGATGGLPLVGGMAGGLAGAVPGAAFTAGAGGVPGAMLGAGLGTGIGIEAKQLLNRALFGDEEPSTTSKEGLEELGTGVATAAATAGVTQGAFNYLTKAPTASVEDWPALNKAVGATQKSIRIGQGAQDVEDATTMPARGLANAGFTSDELNDMTPLERMQAIAPHRQAAGKAIDLAVQDATKEGTTVDTLRPSIDVINTIKNPALKQQASDSIVNLLSDLGIADPSQATPEEARTLRQALTSGARFGPQGDLASLGGIRAQLYRGVTGELHDAVPGLQDLDQHFSDLNEAMKGVQRLTVQSQLKPVLTLTQQAGQAFKQAASPARLVKTAATGAGLALGGGLAYKYLRSLLGE